MLETLLRDRGRDVVVACGLGLLIFFISAFSMLYTQGVWLYAPDGYPAAVDFINVWAAGALVHEGRAAAAYDWDVHGAMERLVLGESFDGYFGFHYPPAMLPLAALLALAPFVPSLLLWLAASFAAYVAALRAIAPGGVVMLFGAAFPATAWNVQLGQNGLMSAALLGGALATLERRPALAGLLIGLLSCKPHLGLLIPFALLAGGHVRAFLVAAATVAALNGAAALLFGPSIFTAFVASLDVMNERLFRQGMVAASKLQTLYGTLRTSGAPHQTALLVHAAFACAVAALTIRLWRGAGPFSAKAAGLCAAALLATPYAFIYDFALLAPAAVFLLVRAPDRPPLIEAVGCAAAVVCVLLAPFLPDIRGLGMVGAGLIFASAVRGGWISPPDVALQKNS